MWWGRLEDVLPAVHIMGAILLVLAMLVCHALLATMHRVLMQVEVPVCLAPIIHPIHVSQALGITITASGHATQDTSTLAPARHA